MILSICFDGFDENFQQLNVPEQSITGMVNKAYIKVYLKTSVWILVFILLFTACSGGSTPGGQTPGWTAQAPTPGNLQQLSPSATPRANLTAMDVTQVGESQQSTLTPTATIKPTKTVAPTLPKPTPTISLTPSVTPQPGPLTLTVNNIRQLTQLAWWGTGVPNTTAWSPDGSLLAVGSTLGVYLYDAHTFEQVRFIYTGEVVSLMAISPDGRTLAIGNNRVSLWDVATGKGLGILPGSVKGWLSNLAFSPGGMWLVALGTDGFIGPPPGRILVWDTDNYQISHIKEFTYGKTPQSFTISHDGRTIAFKSGQKVTLMTTATGKVLDYLPPQINSDNIFFTPDDKYIIAGMSSSRLGIIDLVTLTVDRFIDVEDTDKIMLCPDGTTLAIYYERWQQGILMTSIELWNIETGQLKFMFRVEGLIGSPSFSPDNFQLAMNNKNEVQIWNIETGTLINSVPFEPIVNSIAFGSLTFDGQTSILVLAAGNDAGEVRLIDPELGQVIRTINVSEQPISAVALHPNGQVFAALAEGNKDSEILLYDLGTDTLLKAISVYDLFASYYDLSRDMAFSLDGEAIAIRAGPTMEFKAWDIQSGEFLTYPTRKTWFNAGSIGIGSNGHMIDLRLTSLGNNQVSWEVFDFNTGEVLAASLEMSAFDICSTYRNYAVSSDARYLAFGCDVEKLPIWDLPAQKLVGYMEGHRPGGGEIGSVNITDLYFSPYGYLLATAGYDHTIRFWDASSGDLLLTLSDHTCSVTDIAFSPNGHYLASTSTDGTLRLWGLQP